MGSIGRGPDGGAYAYRSSKAGLNMAMATAAREQARDTGLGARRR